MAYYRDLTKYSYRMGDSSLNVGWLGGCKKNLSYNRLLIWRIRNWLFLRNLKYLCEKTIVLKCRGYHGCDYCRNGTGNGEIRVFAFWGAVYASPTLVYHYVYKHGYRPPIGFIFAVTFLNRKKHAKKLEDYLKKFEERENREIESAYKGKQPLKISKSVPVKVKVVKQNEN